jgi:hypothetical protein
MGDGVDYTDLFSSPDPTTGSWPSGGGGGWSGGQTPVLGGGYPGISGTTGGVIDPSGSTGGSGGGPYGGMSGSGGYGASSGGGIGGFLGSSLGKSLIGTGAQGALGILGNSLTSGNVKANLAEQKAEFAQKIAETIREFNTQQSNRTAEITRRNQLFSAAAPGLLNNIGVNNPAAQQGILGAISPTG